MNQKQAKELHLLFFSFMGIFHKKIVRKFRKEKHFTHKVNKNQAKVIHVLYQFDSLTFTELGKMLDIEKGSLTTIIDQLEELDIVIRTPDPEDRRKYRLSLSAAGKKEMDQVMEKHTQSIIDSFQGVSEKDLEQFFANLRYVVQFMKRL